VVAPGAARDDFGAMEHETTAVTAEAITIAGYRGKQEVIPGGVWSFPPFHSYPRQIRPGERGEPKPEIGS